MLKKLFDRYVNTVGHETAVLHAISAAIAGFVSPVLALGLLTRAVKSAKLTVPAAVAFTCWYYHRAQPLDGDATFAVTELFRPTSPLLVTLSAFGAGFILRRVIEGGLSKKAAMIAGAIALIILAQGQGGLNEIEARDAVIGAEAIASSDSLMRVYSYANEVRLEKGINSPEFQGAYYPFFREISKSVGTVGVPNFRSFVIYREKKQQDAELLKTMSKMGRTHEWVKIVEKREEDPSWPDNFLKP